MIDSLIEAMENLAMWFLLFGVCASIVGGVCWWSARESDLIKEFLDRTADTFFYLGAGLFLSLLFSLVVFINNRDNISIPNVQLAITSSMGGPGIIVR